MNLSIITPHYNDFRGLQGIYNCLQEQTVGDWEWVIVDDLSDPKIRKQIQDWHISLKNEHVQLVLNSSKSNASICRNIGVETALYGHIVFLDADDTISRDFVANRCINFKDFAVFQNNAIIDKQGKIEILKTVDDSHLNYFYKQNLFGLLQQFYGINHS